MGKEKLDRNLASPILKFKSATRELGAPEDFRRRSMELRLHVHLGRVPLNCHRDNLALQTAKAARKLINSLLCACCGREP